MTAGQGVATAVPFGCHARTYPPGTLRPSGDPAAADRRVLDHYLRWKACFLRRGIGGEDGCRAVYTPDAAHPYVAEAQGYGLVITALMAGADPEARSLFDGILRHVRAHPSVNNPELHAAQQDSGGRDVGGSDSATDGDLDIAYGLLLAGRQWGGDYTALALRRVQAVKESEVHPGTRLMKLGDWSSGDWDGVSRTSDGMPGHLRAFRVATGDPFWDEVLDAQLTLTDTVQRRYAPDTGLLPDFVVDTTTGRPRPAPSRVLESPHDGDYHWNACRVPWRLGADAALGGDPRSRVAARRISRWARTAADGDPARLGNGYHLDGTVYGAGWSPAFAAPLAVAALTDEGAQAWLDALWERLCTTPPDPARAYAAGVQLQSMLVISHNAWQP
ncbi:beta-glucanase [Streptomyces sp. NA02950]|uniref:glycosyl hydrolase family 8 n=1 Tax=Streptomyces sp. NA02950 TaxID=2742137 RepID=UPI0015905B33|nr:glycosyl hydrolase family 8 [Streptomyces sp. NA02950]QKV94105.1 beta-glucanase [Streptomyces sp. NA02950]